MLMLVGGGRGGGDSDRAAPVCPPERERCAKPAGVLHPRWQVGWLRAIMVCLRTACAAPAARDAMCAVWQAGKALADTPWYAHVAMDALPPSPCCNQRGPTPGSPNIQLPRRPAPSHTARILQPLCPEAPPTATPPLVHCARHNPVLVNNAGVAIRKPTADFKLDEVRYLFDVNYFGLVAMTDAVLPHMLERRAGKIFHVGSALGYNALPCMGHYSGAGAATGVRVAGRQRCAAQVPQHRLPLRPTCNLAVGRVAPRAPLTASRHALLNPCSHQVCGARLCRHAAC